MKITDTLRTAFGNVKESVKTIGEKVPDHLKSNKNVIMISLILITLTTLYVVFFFKNLSSGETALTKYATITNIIFSVIIFTGVLMLLRQLFNKYTLGVTSPVSIMKTLGFYKRSLIMMSVVALLVGVIYLITSFPTVSNILSIGLNLAIIVGGLYLGYYALNKHAPGVVKNIQATRYLRIIYHGTFVLSCMIVEKFGSIFTNIKETPRFINYIFMGEVILIALYFLLPKLTSKLHSKNSTELLKGPVYLDNKKIIGTYENLKHDEGFNYNYGLSFYAYLNETEPSASVSANLDTNILNYGSKPRITYNVKEQTLRVFMLNGEKQEEEVVYSTTKIPLQKWNNFVLNYNSGTLDVFVNGSLVATRNNLVPYMNLDNVISGESNGLRGGIKDVKYYNKPLTKFQINMLQEFS